MSRTLYDCPRISRRITGTLFGVESLTRAGFIASGTVSALVAVQLGGHAAWAGIPSAVLQSAAAVSALLVGITTERIGRRRGLALGLSVGVFGAGAAAGAIAAGIWLLFLAGLMLMGVASAAMLLGRFAVAEVHPPERRGRAISKVVIGGATGAVVGPLLVGPSGKVAVMVGVDELAGPYAAAMLIIAIASLAIFAWLRPDPRDVGRKMAAKHPEPAVHLGPARSIGQILRAPGVLVAVVAMAVAQMVMVMLMVITSLHMEAHGHGLTEISLVISAHTLGMFAFSFLSGWLVDRWGRGQVILVGAGLLVLACILAPLSPALFPLSASLFLLGLGWNLCYVGGSTLLSDQLTAAERAKTQGANDLLIGLSSASASLGSGLLFALTGYASMGVIGLALSLVPIGLTVWWLIRLRKPLAARLQAFTEVGDGR